MNRIVDPFPPTPEGFHRRVADTLQSLGEARTRRTRAKAALLIAAIVAALTLATALAAVVGRSGFKRRLADAGADEAAQLVEEPHLSAPGADGIDFQFAIDEIVWEGGDLYISYSLSVPEDGSYLVAMSNPTLNGDRLAYDAKGWTTPKFIDPIEGSPAVLLMGGGHRTRCSELWTFAVDPRWKRNPDSRLAFRAVLYQTDLDRAGSADWTDLLDPPDSLTDNALDAIGHAEYVAERAIDMGLNAAALGEAVRNDVTQRDFDVSDFHIHVEAFRMTHLGLSLEYTLSIPGAEPGDRRYDDLLALEWRFCASDGKPLGESLGATGSAAREALEDGTVVYRCAYRDSTPLNLSEIESVLFVPDGDPQRAIRLTPTYNPDIPNPSPSPKPTAEPGEDISK